MENLNEKNEEFEQEDDSQETSPEAAADDSEVDKKDNEQQKHHRHGHPHIVTIGHSSHGRSNARSFGIDHEPGARI